MPRIAYAAAAFVLGALTLTACAGTSAGGAAGTKIDAERVASVAEGAARAVGVTSPASGRSRSWSCPSRSLTAARRWTTRRPARSSAPTMSRPPPGPLRGPRARRGRGPRAPAPRPGLGRPGLGRRARRLGRPHSRHRTPRAGPPRRARDLLRRHVRRPRHHRPQGHRAERHRGAGRAQAGRLPRWADRGHGARRRLPRVRIDLREQDARVALQVVHTGAGGSVVEAFGAQRAAPLKDVRYVP